jgi:hypothetical protein
MIRQIFLLLLSLFLSSIFSALISSCATSPTSPPGPEWIHQPTRSVDNGYIVYIGHGEGPNPEIATFRAEGGALEDLANECSMIPKGTRTEDHFVEKTQSGSSAYVKVALEFQQCHEAQNSVDPEAIKKIANTSYTSQLKRYQDYEETGFMSASQEGPPIEPPAEFPEAPAREARWDDATHFYVTRQYVAYQKELVILAPPQSYTPGSVESQKLKAALAPATQNLVALQSKDPGLALHPQPWSQWKDRPHVSRPSSLAPPRAEHSHYELKVPAKPLPAKETISRPKNGSQPHKKRKKFQKASEIHSGG